MYSAVLHLQPWKSVSRTGLAGVILRHQLKIPGTMKTTGNIILALILFLFSPDQSYCGNEPAYSLVKGSSGISIYTRWIPVTSSRSARQIKAVVVIDATVAEVLSVLRDDGSVSKWMNSTKDYHRLRTIDSGSWYSYVQFAIPWPLNNQDCIIRYDVKEDPGSGKVTIDLHGAPGYLQPFDGVKRIPHMEGSWVITDLGNNKVLVEYTMFSAQKPSYPRWITDPLVQNSLLKTMEAFRSIVLSKSIKQ